jgi:hypothetical protein
MNGEIDFFIPENIEKLTDSKLTPDAFQAGTPVLPSPTVYMFQYEILNY